MVLNRKQRRAQQFGYVRDVDGIVIAQPFSDTRKYYTRSIEITSINFPSISHEISFASSDDWHARDLIKKPSSSIDFAIYDLLWEVPEMYFDDELAEEREALTNEDITRYFNDCH